MGTRLTLRQVCGLLIDVLRKLSGENGEEWAKRIKKVLRGEAVPQPVQTELVSCGADAQMSQDGNRKLVKVYEFELVGLQRIRHLDEDATRLRIKKDGESEQIEIFFGAVPESYFLLLLNKRAKMTRTSEGFSIDGGYISSTDQRLEILSGELAGQYFTGRHSTID